MTSRVLVYDPYVGGHHPLYLRHLLGHWQSRGWPFEVVLAVPPAMLDLDPILQTLVDAAGSALTVESIPKRRGRAGLRGVVHNDIATGFEIRRLIHRVRPTDTLCMYFDHAQLSTAFILRRRDFRISGVFFRPATALRNRYRKSLLERVLRSPSLTRLFVLDPTNIDDLNRMAHRHVATWLPDGIEDELIAATSDSDEANSSEVSVGAAGTLRLLLVGSISRRKGIELIAEAAQLLEPSAAEKTELVVAGPQETSESEQINAALAQLRSSLADVRVDNRFLSTSAMHAHLAESDVVLTPYVEHSGSSNIVIHAAAAAKPVIATDLDLLGRTVRENQLGLVVDPNDATALAHALSTVFASRTIPFRADMARAFAQKNSASAFAETITGGLLEAIGAPDGSSEQRR